MIDQHNRVQSALKVKQGNSTSTGGLTKQSFCNFIMSRFSFSLSLFLTHSLLM